MSHYPATDNKRYAPRFVRQNPGGSNEPETRAETHRWGGRWGTDEA
jgi:hypothetical protein